MAGEGALYLSGVLRQIDGVVTDEAVVGEVVDAAAGFARRPHHLVAGDRGRRDAQRRRRHETHKCCHLLLIIQIKHLLIQLYVEYYITNSTL